VALGVGRAIDVAGTAATEDRRLEFAAVRGDRASAEARLLLTSARLAALHIVGVAVCRGACVARRQHRAAQPRRVHEARLEVGRLPLLAGECKAAAHGARGETATAIALLGKRSACTRDAGIAHASALAEFALCATVVVAAGCVRQPGG